MGEIEGTYRVLQTAGTRLGAQTPIGVSTLEPGQMLSPKMQEKHMHVRVKLLDNTVEIFDIEPKCDGQVLLAQVWKHLNLMECDYFGLEFQNIQSYWIWLEPMKSIIRQIHRPKNAILRLAVKFFPPDPGQLQEEYTRRFFFDFKKYVFVPSEVAYTCNPSIQKACEAGESLRVGNESST